MRIGRASRHTRGRRERTFRRQIRGSSGQQWMRSSSSPFLTDHLGVWRWIGRDDVEAACEVVGGPARADDAGADDGDAMNAFVERHDEGPSYTRSVYAMPVRLPWPEASTRASEPSSRAE